MIKIQDDQLVIICLVVIVVAAMIMFKLDAKDIVQTVVSGFIGFLGGKGLAK